MFLQPPIVSLYSQVQPPAIWKPKIYKERIFEIPDKIYAPYDPNDYQKSINFDYGQNAEASDEDDEPVSASVEQESDDEYSDNRI